MTDPITRKFRLACLRIRRCGDVNGGVPDVWFEFIAAGRPAGVRLCSVKHIMARVPCVIDVVVEMVWLDKISPALTTFHLGSIACRVLLFFLRSKRLLES